MDRNAPIGVFDSGVGGLTVAREIMSQMPEENMIYFGDIARVPYGTKSKDTVIRYSQQVIRFLKEQGVKAIVIACNTATACALEEVEKDADIPVIGVIRAGAKAAMEATRSGRVGIIATEATIASGVYTDTMMEMRSDVRVTGKACPLLVPLVEEGLLEDPVTEEIASRYLKELKEADIDTLVMGCTHYPLLYSTIERIMGEKVALINPAYETARELRNLLKERKLNCLTSEGGRGKHRLFVSDRADSFTRFASSILPQDAGETIQINIEEY